MALSDGDYTYSVGELGREVARVVDAAFPAEVWVRGEIRNISRSPVGHVYFDLVDPDRADAVLPVVLLRANRGAVNRHLVRTGAGRMVDGTDVRVGGFVGYFAAKGVVQLRMTRIDADYTIGRLAAARDALLRRLAAAGLLEANRRLPLPLVPDRIGLVTSAASAAAADFLAELDGGGFAVLLADARVQGADAPASLVAALGAVVGRGVDVVALVRGGGSRTDLAAFDSEEVARAIAAAPVPVLTGVGHEVDESVADRVAHTSFKTPTACGAALRGAVAEFGARVERAWAGLARAADRRVTGEAQRLHRLGLRAGRATRGTLEGQAALLDLARDRVGRAAAAELRAAGQRADGVAARVAVAAPRRLAAAEQRLGAAGDRVRALDPAEVLARGWSITRDAAGRTVRSVGEVAEGAELVTVLADGEVGSRVGWIGSRPGGMGEAGP